MDVLDDREGIERERYLQNEHWPRRENVANILFDTVLQAFPSDATALLSDALQTDFSRVDLVAVKTLNPTRALTGQPDTMLLDERNQKIILIEIKIGRSTARYSQIST